MIIKNGEMTLLVNDTDRALEQVTDAAVNNGGYIVSSRTAMDRGYKAARITMGVPVEQFEAVQRQLRALAVQVLADTSSGQDVSDQ
jgi:glycine cleavage system regulatory protein